MVDLLIALGLMVAVVGPLLAWIVRADRRRRLHAGASPDTGKGEVA